MSNKRKIVGKPLTALFCASAAASILLTQLGEGVSTQSLEEFARDKDIPMQVFEDLPHKDHTRVYRDNIAGFYYDVGHNTWTTADLLSKQIVSNDERIYLRATVKVGSSVLIYPATLAMQLLGNLVAGDLNAYAIPGVSSADTCYINPPGDMTLVSFIHQFTDIPEEHLSDITDEVAPIVPIMAHEAEHCNLVLGETFKERGLKSFTTGGESNADNHYMKMHKSIYPQSNMDKSFFYTRAVSLFSRENIFDGGHATSLNVDAFLNGVEMPSREQAYYNYGHLNELIKKELLDFESDDDGAYYQAAYQAVQKLLRESDELTPFMRRAAEIYLEGVEYLADKSPLFTTSATPHKAQVLQGPLV